MIRKTAGRSEVRHAQDLQLRRIALGKRGYAKAVRRYLKRQGANYAGCKSVLPVKW